MRNQRDAIRKRDLKLLTLVNDGYETLYLNMGYDGIQRKAACDDGFRIATDIIERCAGVKRPFFLLNRRKYSLNPVLDSSECAIFASLTTNTDPWETKQFGFFLSF